MAGALARNAMKRIRHSGFTALAKKVAVFECDAFKK
jgi:hypothetical protein